MRLLMAMTLVLASGCRCEIFREEPDECTSDSQCPDNDGEYCNGVGACESGFFGPARCGIRQPECYGIDYCDEVSRSCQPCESPDDAPECFSLYDGGHDAGPDAGPGLESFCDISIPSTTRIGSSCELGTCRAGLECLAEVTTVVGPIERTSGELCSLPCDPTAAETGCPSCAACLDAVHVGQASVAVADIGRSPYCATRCVPSDSGSDCRDGFTCDVITGTCQEACASDQECRLVRDELGALVEDPTSTHFCDAVTGRCRTPGTPGAQIGDACSTDADCTMDGVCLRGDGWPDTGFCTRFGCEWGGLRCDEGAECHYRELDRAACLIGCTVDTALPTENIGVGGHAEGCAPGFSCRWDGHSTDDFPNGGCTPGNYNDVAAPNIGASCTRDDECHSPFGFGRCIWAESGLGTCALIDCGDAYPGIPCGDGASCVALGDDTLCLRTCTAASDCASGHACTPAPSGALVCAPVPL